MKSFRHQHVFGLCSVKMITLVIFLTTSTNKLQAQDGATIEKKVDYLEQIYFSGENKAGLNVKMQIALQQMQNLQPTPALAQQVTYLLDLQQKSADAGNACEVLDLLSVGIYQIDALEAKEQGVLPPSDKAKKKSADALENLSKLSTSSSSLSTSARNLEWSSYMLSGGRYGSFASGAGKVANGAGMVGATVGTAGQLAETAGQIKGLGQSLGVFKKADSPCKAVPTKMIALGQHATLSALAGAPGAAPGSTTTVTADAANTVSASDQTTVINIPLISNALLRSLTHSIRLMPKVRTAEKTFNQTQSTITVVHTCTLDVLADWIEDKMGKNLALVNYGNGAINVAMKTKCVNYEVSYQVPV